MKCQNCGRNEANVSYTRIINGEKMELHLCNECAQKMNIGVSVNFGFDELFSQFFNHFGRVESLMMPGFHGISALEDGLNDWMHDDFFEGDFFWRNSNDRSNEN